MRGQEKCKMVAKQAREDKLCELVRHLRLPITDMAIVDRAFTHTSYANEHKANRILHNERLEFLGDAVLDLIIGEYLFRTYPQMTEGELTKVKAAVVCEHSLASVSASLRFGDYLLLGRGEHASGGRQRPSILADTFEAFIGALYVTTSYGEATQFVLSHLQAYVEKALAGQLEKDYKTQLQEFVQRDGERIIRYFLVAESGPDHDKLFTMSVSIDEKVCGTGTGKSKKEAEQQAAREALLILKKE